MFPAEDSPRGLGRTLGKRVGGNPSRVRISYPPPVPHRARCRRAPLFAVGPFDVVRLSWFLGRLRAGPGGFQSASPTCCASLRSMVPVTCTQRARMRAAPPVSQPVIESITTSGTPRIRSTVDRGSCHGVRRGPAIPPEGDPRWSTPYTVSLTLKDCERRRRTVSTRAGDLSRHNEHRTPTRQAAGRQQRHRPGQRSNLPSITSASQAEVSSPSGARQSSQTRIASSALAAASKNCVRPSNQGRPHSREPGSLHPRG